MVASVASSSASNDTTARCSTSSTSTPDAPVADETSIFSTGEALWALAHAPEAFPAEGFDQPAWTTLDYLATERDSSEDYFPQPWPDQWAAYSLGEMAELGARRCTTSTTPGALLERYSSSRPLRRPAGHELRLADPRTGTPRVGAWAPGSRALAALRPLTLSDARLTDAADGTTEALACGAARLAADQVPAAEDTPPELAGAWFYDDVTRMDDQQHPPPAMLGAEPVLP